MIAELSMAAAPGGNTGCGDELQWTKSDEDLLDRHQQDLTRLGRVDAGLGDKEDTDG